MSPEQKEGLLQDRVALIVGGGADGSTELALELANLGSDIAIIYLVPSPDEAAGLKRQLEARGRRCLLISPEDLRDDQMGGAVDLVRQELGSVDLFIDFSAERKSSSELDSRRRLAASDLFPHYHLLEEVMSHLADSAGDDVGR
ncbi:MAG: hypothetical protein R3300_08805 [Candidatus Promineifilaceae bacterium]|nr:hypothetical protein [Candidatus Promineifilaceae bacterium]